MNPIVYHIAGGGSFFTGAVLICISAGLMPLEYKLLRRFGLFLFLLGCVLVSVSSTPLPYWLLVLVIGVSFVWVLRFPKEHWRKWLTIAVILSWLMAVSWEATHWITPQPQPVPHRAIAIIGDSVTAGMGMRNEVTWPRLLAKQHGIEVDDQSGSGFTTSQALARAEFEGVDSPLVLVEIGGNDLLGGQSSAEFQRDLDALLMLLTQDKRQVVMLELPLIPFYGNYGRVQRSLARKHGVLLVPKRVFLNIIAPPEYTLDTIHLTDEGHQAMADAMWQILSPAYGNRN